jgi:hypothetical protein
MQRRKIRTRVAWLVMAAVCTADSPAMAGESNAHAFAGVEAIAAVGGPLGWLGASLVVRPIGPLAVHVGAGIGSQSPQVAAGARWQLYWHDATATGVAVGGAWSMGQYAGVVKDALVIPETSHGAPPIYFWSRAHFANAELSVEKKLARSRPAPSLRSFVGLGYVVNGADGVIATDACLVGRCGTAPGLGPRLVLFFGVAIAMDLR